MRTPTNASSLQMTMTHAIATLDRTTSLMEEGRETETRTSHRIVVGIGTTGKAGQAVGRAKTMVREAIDTVIEIARGEMGMEKVVTQARAERIEAERSASITHGAETAIQALKIASEAAEALAWLADGETENTEKIATGAETTG